MKFHQQIYNLRAETSAHCHISSNITNNCYHQRSSEKFVLHLIYNVFIAPFYTVLATCGVSFSTLLLPSSSDFLALSGFTTGASILR
uniref:Uncharacterized protein n=1 Tax=Ditylenchus dipsaci TaxID=166011 RepID=A0A915EP58_9BILA